MLSSSEQVLLDRYRLGPVIGRGGMAEVHEAVDVRLSRRVAVKVLRSEISDDPEARRRFSEEAHAAALLNHPNVVKVYDCGEHEGRAFLVMECIDGPTLADEISGGALPISWVRGIALEILSALDAAHRAGVVHRDIKPANVLVAPDGRHVVTDFGIAKAADGTDITRAGEIVGTAAYLAPERLRGEPASSRTDIYSLGVLLCEALTGRKPYPGHTPVALATAISLHPPPTLEELRADEDPTLAAAVLRALSKDPVERFATPAEMAAAIGRPPRRTRPASGRAEPTATMAPTRAVTPVPPVPSQPGGPPTQPSPLMRPPDAALPAGRAPRTGVRWPPLLAAALAAALLLAGMAALALRDRFGQGSTAGATTEATATPGQTPPPLARAIDELEKAVQP